MATWRRGAKLKFASSYFRRSYRNNMRSVVHLHNSTTKAEVFLVGVDHLSPKSTDFVRHVIRDLQPNVVAVELCKRRGEDLLSTQQHKPVTWGEIFALDGGLTEKILHFSMHKVYERFAATGVKPGEELRVAIEEGLAYGANIVYMDQDVDITSKRTVQEFSLMELFRFILRWKEIYRQYPVIFKAINSGDPDQLADAIMHPKAQEEALSLGDQYFPGLAKSMVHERNEYMVKKLRNMSGSIVGVVGALHVQGMLKLWQDAEGKDMICGGEIN